MPSFAPRDESIMTTPNGALEFVNGPARHRTPRIAPEKWEKHRPRITKLYLASKKLAEVVTLMQLEHGFYANERQYTHHLSKWGVKKQARGSTATATMSPAGSDGISGLGQRDLLKRRRPSASIHSFSSCDSALSRPPRKKVEQNAALPTESLDVSAEDLEHGWVEDKSCWTASASPTTTNTASHTGLESPGTPMTGSDSVHEASVDDLNASLEANDAAEIPPAAIGIARSPLHLIQQGNALGPQRPLPPIPAPKTKSRPVTLAQQRDDTTNSKGSSLAPPPITQTAVRTVNPIHDNASVTQLSSPPVISPATPARTIRTIDRNRPIETFSAQDIADIKHAAECLSMFCCNQEAFELYTTILKRQLSDPTYRDETFWYLVIQCAHTASIPEHVEVVQNIVRAEIARVQQSQSVGRLNSLAINLLLHMLLAFTSSRNMNSEDVATNISKAHSYLFPSEKGLALIFQQLPPDDRSLDLVIYRNVIRLRASESCDLTSPVPFEFAPFGLWRENKVPLEEWILYRVPGPFELQKNGRMANPCIRSCVSWCEGTLQVLGSSPITPGIVDFCGDKIGIAWAEANALFITLWEHWVTYASPVGLAWMNETQDRMGISATELLMLVCRAIHDSYYAWNAPAKSDDELIRRLRKKAEDLVQESDLRLARRVLKQYISRNTVTLWPPWRSAVQRLEKARMIRSFEKVLLVRFPRLGVTRDLIHSVLIPLEEEGFPVFSKARQLSPTLASSLSSLDLSDFTKTGVSAVLRLSKLTRGPSSIPSVLSQSRSGTKMSIAGVTDINTSLRSMSISGESASRKRTSSQVVSTIVSESDHHSEQPSAERELDSDRMSAATWI